VAAAAAVVTCCALALIFPAAITTFGLEVKTGPGEVRLIADGLAFRRANVGEIAAINDLCAAIPGDSSVLIVDQKLMEQMAQDIRGMCGVPTAGLTTVTTATVEADVRAIERAGRRPVLLGTKYSQLTPFANGTIRKVMSLHTSIDDRLIFGAPRSTDPVRFTVYRWEPGQ